MEGDSAYIKKLYDSLFPKIKHWIIQNNGTPEQAADLFQEVLISIITGDKKDVTNTEGFIFQMCKFRWIDQLRKKNVSTRVINDIKTRQDVEESIENQFIALEDEKLKFVVLESAFSKLSEVCKELISLIKNGKKPSDIVNEMNFNSNNTFYRRKFACFDAWKKFLKEDERYNNIIL